MAPREFTTPVLDPIEFAIDGETFTATATPPANALLAMARLSGGDEAGGSSNARSMAVITEFFELTLLDESYERFKQRLSDRDRPVTFSTAIEVFQFLVGEYSTRPTELPSGSPAGQ